MGLDSQHIQERYYNVLGTYVNKIVTKQKNAIGIMGRTQHNAHTSPLFKQMYIIKLHDLYQLQIVKYMYNCSKQSLPFPLTHIITFNETIHTYSEIDILNPHITQRRISIVSKCLRHKDPEIWYL